MLRGTEVEGQRGQWKDRQRAQRLRDREAEGQRNQGAEQYRVQGTERLGDGEAKGQGLKDKG